MDMKWIKVDQITGEPMKKSNSFEAHDYVCFEERLRIVNNSFIVRKKAWVLTTLEGKELGRFDTLKSAKAESEFIVSAMVLAGAKFVK